MQIFNEVLSPLGSTRQFPTLKLLALLICELLPTPSTRHVVAPRTAVGKGQDSAQAGDSWAQSNPWMSFLRLVQYSKILAISHLCFCYFWLSWKN